MTTTLSASARVCAAAGAGAGEERDNFFFKKWITYSLYGLDAPARLKPVRVHENVVQNHKLSKNRCPRLKFVVAARCGKGNGDAASTVAVLIAVVLGHGALSHQNPTIRLRPHSSRARRSGWLSKQVA